MLKTPLLLLTFLCSVTLAFAQQKTVFEDTKNEQYVYSYANVQGTYQNAIRNILRDIAPNDYQYAGFDLRFRQYGKLTQQLSALMQFNGLIRFNNISVANAPKHKGFEVNDILVPEVVNITADVVKNGHVVVSKSFTGLTITNGAIPEQVFSFVDSSAGLANAHTLVFRQIEFGFGSNTQSNLQRRFRAVADYERAYSDLQAMGANLMQINTVNPDPDMINGSMATLGAMDKTYQDYPKSPFWQELKLNDAGSPDPLGMRLLLNRFGADFGAKRAQMTALAANAHTLFFDRGLQFYNNNRKTQARQDFQKSVAAAPKFAPANYMLAVLEWEDHKPDAAAEILTNTNNNMPVDAELRTKIQGLAKYIFEDYNRAGDDLLKGKKYSEAVKAYKKSIFFANNMSNWQVDLNPVKSSIDNVYTVDLEERVMIAQSQWRDKKFADALRQIEECLQFQKDYNVKSQYDIPKFKTTVITDYYGFEYTKTKQLADAFQNDAAAESFKTLDDILKKYPTELKDDLGLNDLKKTTYQRIFDGMTSAAAKFLSDGESFLLAKDYEKAEKALTSSFDNAFGRADNYARYYPSYLNSGSLQTLKTQQKDLIGRLYTNWGDDLDKRGDHNKALTKYELAKHYTGGTNTAIDNKISGSAKQDILTKVGEVLSTNPNSNYSLNKYLSELTIYAKQYNLSNDYEVTDAFTRLSNKVCDNARNQIFPSLTREIGNLINAKSYIEAKAKIKSADDTLRLYSGCNIDASALQAVREEVNLCSEYQEIVKKAKEDERSNIYGSALDGFEKAAKYYDATPIVKGKLLPDDSHNLFDYMKMSARSAAFVYNGGLYFSDKNDIDKAFELLKLSLKNGYQAKSTSMLQVRLGNAFGKKNFQTGIKYKDAFAAICPPELSKALKTMKKAFRKSYK